MMTRERDTMDIDPRPLKRMKLMTSESSLSNALVPTTTASTPTPAVPAAPAPMPTAPPAPAPLPPTYQPTYFKSLSLSRLAFQRCLAMQSLDSDVECRAWTGLAEVGIRYGLDGAEGVEYEVEKAVTKALLIAQNHPSLRPYKIHLTLLSARLAQHQLNHKFSQTTLRRLLTNGLAPNDPPHLLYTSHLAYIKSLSEASFGTSPDAGTPNTRNMKALAAIQDMHSVASSRGHGDIMKLAALLRLQTLIQMGFTTEMIQEGLDAMERLLEFPVDAPPPPPQARHSPNLSRTQTQPQTQTTSLLETAAAFAHIKRRDNDKAFLVYTLILGVIFYTHIGDAAATEARTRVLHEMLDGSALGAFGPFGILQISFPSSSSSTSTPGFPGRSIPAATTSTQPLYVQTTHPRVLFALAFLVTAIAKRDPVGRKPKRKVFAGEGLAVVERELQKEVAVPMWASERDVVEHRLRLQKLKADMMCEIIGVCIMRSEFGEAETTMAELIAHTRNHHLFNFYSGRITLLQAQLAHALGYPERAVQCYRVAALLSRKREEGLPLGAKQAGGRKEGAGGGNEEEEEDYDGVEDGWIHAAACAGELWVRIGLIRAGTPSDERQFEEQQWHIEELKRTSEDVIRACESVGGTLGAIATVLKACLTSEYLKAKILLRDALNTVTKSTDNHLRALILALIASQYLDTSSEHAEAMLATAEQLAAGLGAQPRPPKGSSGNAGSQGKAKGGDGVGNAPLRLWIGERSLEEIRDEVAVQQQEGMNVKLRVAKMRIEQRRSMFVPAGKEGSVPASAVTNPPVRGVSVGEDGARR
ncbi:hypothetical protein BKA70DRAFT_1318603 [Coprinopsis sp. MPI-PUGE-AT-0042]|nr:hypothetical protein BKA70DRAFT_1318603 [Coprinopsis sp. MPI-PUGE-AT-0042]